MVFLPCLFINTVCLGMNLKNKNYIMSVVSGIGVALSLVGLCSTI